MIAELLKGPSVERPPTAAIDETFKRAAKAQKKLTVQHELGL
jgi:hypothetical protein